jgi:UDP-N-acetylmuramyl pentapeptide phosphotransferase/UDP-N-acetylglucosamine-1-phosphate transferase
MTEVLLSTIGFLILLWLYRLVVLRFENLFSNLVLPDRFTNDPRIVSGGGLILICCLFFWDAVSPLERLGIALMTLVGFFDDYKKLGILLRLVCYAVGVLLIVLFRGSTELAPFLVLLLFVGYLGFVNAVNFMDGLNGLVVLQSVVILLGMLWCDHWVDSKDFLLLLLGCLFAFGYFNLRRDALLYLGDAGSIGIGFILFGLMLEGVFRGLSLGYLIYFAVMGVEVISVLLIRLWAGENVFERHQKHLYQRLAFELGWRDMSVSIVYAAIQLGLIFLWEWRLKQMDNAFLLSVGIYFILFVVHRLIYRSMGKPI